MEIECKCEFCSKAFATKYSVIRHYQVCRNKLEADNNLQVEYIEYLSNILLSNKLKFNSIDTFKTEPIPENLIFPFSQERLSIFVKKIKTIAKSDILKFCKRLLMHENRIIYNISDLSRKVFCFIDNNGNMVRDNKCKKLTEYILPFINAQFKLLIDIECNKIQESEPTSSSPSESSDSGSGSSSDQLVKPIKTKKTVRQDLDQKSNQIITFIGSKKFVDRIIDFASINL